MKTFTLFSFIDIASPLLVLFFFRIFNALIQRVCQADHLVSQFTSLLLVGEVASNLNSCVVILRQLISKMYTQSDSSYRVMTTAFIINVLGVLFCVEEISHHNACQDAFGVIMISSHMSALLTTLPLALWTALFSGSVQPNAHDMHALLCMTAMLVVYSLKLFAMENQWVYDVTVGFLTACSIGFMAWSIVMTKSLCSQSNESGAIFLAPEAEVEEENAITAMRRSFVIICASAICVFLLVHSLSALHVIGPDMTLLLNIVTDIFFRLFFTITALDVHATFYQNIEAELRSEKKSHLRRKAFMKYIFHEMRIPLNSLTMAIDVLRSDFTANKNIDELLDTMESSSSFMEHALNSYITVQQIEEHHFKLNEDVIDLQSFFGDAVRKLSKTLNHTYGIDMVADVPTSFPSQIIGDEKQLNYILNNIVMHAARLSKDQIKIDVVGGYRGGDEGQEFEISVCVIGNGARIADFEKELFFSPYGMLFTGEIEKNSMEGMSLLISKEIIKLYGGLMTVFSNDGGTVYSFQIPFKIPLTEEQVRKKKAKKESKLYFLSSWPGSAAVLPDKSKVPLSRVSSSSGECASTSSGGGMETPLNALHMANGSLYFQPRSNMGSCDSLVLDLNMLADESSSNQSRASLSSTAKQSSGQISNASGVCSSDTPYSFDHEDDYGLYDMDDLEAVEYPPPPDHQTIPAPCHVSSMSPPPLPAMPSSSPCKQSNEKNEEKPKSRFDEKLRQLEQDGEKVSNLNVMVVDDTPCNLKMLQWLLLLSAVKSTPAVNGYEAIVAFERGTPRFDLIFMDNTMPIMSGLEAVRYMRGRGFNGVIVAVTGNAMPDEIHDFLDDGADLVVTKPMKMNKLKQILNCFPEGVHTEDSAEADTEKTRTRQKVHQLSLDEI